MKKYSVGSIMKRVEVEDIVFDICKRLKNIVIKKEPIIDGQTVYFDRNCESPRRSFQADYPLCKIVYDPDLADIIIVSDVIKEWHVSIRDMFRDVQSGINYWHQNILDEKVIVTPSHIRSLNHIFEKESMLKSGKMFVTDKMIKLSSTFTREISPEEKDSINKMISSDNVEMAHLGLKMLMNFDMVQNEETYVLAFLQMKHSHILSGSRTLKAIKSKIKAKYVNLHI